VIGLTLASGVIHGRLSNRWGPSADMVAAAARLQQVPAQIGDWQLQESRPLDKNAADILQCAGYIFRTYVNQKTREAANVTVIIGPPVPTAIHDPEICYSGQGYELGTPRQRVLISAHEGAQHELWSVTLRSKDLESGFVKVYYGLSTGDRWQAPEGARLMLAGKPYLYKVQSAMYLPPGADLEASDPCRSFLEAFLPTVKQYLIEAAGE
jgi:hypothetical protein